MYQHHYTGAYKFLLTDSLISEFKIRNRRWFWEKENYLLSYVVSYSIKYLLSHMYDTNYSHCKHMFLCYIMLWIHFLYASSGGRRKSRWNRWITEQNPGGVEAGALYGGENTHQVKESNIYLRNLISWTLGSMFYMYSNSHQKFFKEQSVFSSQLYMHINVYKDKNILPLLVRSSSKYLKHTTVLIHSSHINANKQNSY